MWFWNVLWWVIGSIIVIFVWLNLIGWIIWFIYAPIKEYFEKKKQRKIADRDKEKQWERVSKELKESWFSLDAGKMKMTAKMKKDKKVATIALAIVGLLILAGMIISYF